MPIKAIKGSIFDSPAQVLVNPVNTIGDMGKGLALEFKQRYPLMFQHYQHICAFDDLKPSQLFVWSNGNITIINFPTKTHWRNPSNLSLIKAGLLKFTKIATAPLLQLGKPWQSVAFPKLGCGAGGLDWSSQVRPLMFEHLGNLEIDIFIIV